MSHVSVTKKKKFFHTGDKERDWEIAAQRSLFHQYRWNAKTRKIAFEIERWLFERLLKGNCYYCGSEPSNTMVATMKQRKYWEFGEPMTYKYNGVDRVDNSIGYTEDNVVPCCGTCNRMKLDMGKKEFLAHIQKIYEFQNN
jgi:hypothetical protein